MMNKRSISLSILAVITSLLTACGTWAVVTQSEEPVAPEAVSYQTLLGKSMSDTVVADFINNNCSSVGPYQVCKELGMAFWTDSNKIMRIVYLYSGKADGFKSYKGELPFGLKFYDTLGAVEYKLNRQGVGNHGLPDEARVPDRVHYWAFYKQAGVTIIYNAPFPDEDATIYAILVTS